MSTSQLRPFHTVLSAFSAGSDTPRAYLERCIERIESLEGAVGAFVHRSYAEARAASDQSTGRWASGKPLSRIDGMPVGVKDIIETVDAPTQHGSPIYTGAHSGRDAASVWAMRRAGAVIVGKTVTTEFAATEPRGTRNPHDLERTPGGSSSGSAAAVGAGMLPLALGTQVIGSILRPSSFCGCVGFKPTMGAINRGGSHDGLSQSAHGVLAASIEDAWISLREIADRVGGDPGCAGLFGPAEVPLAALPTRLIVLDTPGWRVATEQAKAQREGAVARLARAGVAMRSRQNDPVIEALEVALERANPVSRAINGWESVWPMGSYVLNGAMQLKLVNTATNEIVPLPVTTIADKCVWTTDDSAIYCGIPVSPPSDSLYPDDWYQGTVQFSDRIWKIDVAGRFAQLVLDFSKETSSATQTINSFDATALAIDPLTTELVFINKNDGSLWSYQL